MGLLIAIILGIIVGAVASWITGSAHGIVWDMVLGVIGAFVGGLIMNLLGYSGVNGFNFYSFIVALLGAIIVIYLGRLLTRGTTRRTF